MGNKLNLRPSERRLMVGVALALFVVVNIWFVWPHFGDLQQVKNKRTAALEKLTLYNEEISKVPGREAEVKRLESAGSNVDGQDQAIELLRAIDKQARLHDVDITGSSRQMTRTNDFFMEKSQNIVALSGETQLVEFLYALGSGNSTIRVRDLSIRPDAPRYNLASNIKLVSSYRLNSSGKRKAGPAKTSKK